MDGADKHIDNPLNLAVRQFRNFYEIVDMRYARTPAVLPKALRGRYTTEGDAVDAIVRHVLSKQSPAYRKDGRPVFTPRGARGRRANSRNKPGYVTRWSSSNVPS